MVEFWEKETVLFAAKASDYGAAEDRGGGRFSSFTPTMTRSFRFRERLRSLFGRWLPFL